MLIRRILFSQSPTHIRVRGAAARGASGPQAPAAATPAEATLDSPFPPPPPVVPPPVFVPPEPAPVPEADLRPLVETLLHAVEELELRRRGVLGELQQATIELAVAIASKLTYRVIEAGEFAVEKLVQDAVSRLPANGPVSVWLNPEDLKLLQARLSPEEFRALTSDHIRLLPDATVSRTGCRAELPEEGILSDLHLTLGDLHEELMEGLADAQIERRRTQAADRNLRRFPDRRETA
jgi:hypothetical protein